MASDVPERLTMRYTQSEFATAGKMAEIKVVLMYRREGLSTETYMQLSNSLARHLFIKMPYLRGRLRACAEPSAVGFYIKDTDPYALFASVARAMMWAGLMYGYAPPEIDLVLYNTGISPDNLKSMMIEIWLKPTVGD